MAEHLHGYPRCETPAGTLCGSSDLHWEECKNHGAIRSCEASVVDGIPTGQYRCTHDEAAARAASKPKKASKGGAKPKKKPAARKPAKKSRPAARKAKKAARKPAKKARPAARKKARAPKKKGGVRKKK